MSNNTLFDWLLKMIRAVLNEREYSVKSTTRRSSPIISKSTICNCSSHYWIASHCHSTSSKIIIKVWRREREGPSEDTNSSNICINIILIRNQTMCHCHIRHSSLIILIPLVHYFLQILKLYNTLSHCISCDINWSTSCAKIWKEVRGRENERSISESQSTGPGGFVGSEDARCDCYNSIVIIKTLKIKCPFFHHWLCPSITSEVRRENDKLGNIGKWSSCTVHAGRIERRKKKR